MSYDVCDAEIMTIVWKALICLLTFVMNDYTAPHWDKVCYTNAAEIYLTFLDVIVPQTHIMTYIIITLCTLNCTFNKTLFETKHIQINIYIYIYINLINCTHIIILFSWKITSK